MDEGRGFRRPRRGGEPNPLPGMPDLLDAAIDEFSRKSFEEASLNAILKAAGVNKGSFYHRFADKLDLYLCMADVISQAKLAQLAEARRGATFPAGFFERVRFLAGLGLAFARSEPRYYALSMRFPGESAVVRRAVDEALPGGGRDSLRDLVDAAHAAGEFRPSLPKAFVHDVVALLIRHLDALVPAEATEDDVARVLDHLVDTLEHGLAARAP